MRPVGISGLQAGEDVKKKQDGPKRMHLAFRRGVTSTPDTRCGTGSTRDVTTDEALVTCRLCQYWAHRGYTADTGGL
jgi:hypothetical protein